MAEQQMTQEEMLAQQKANCPFCKIVAGQIPSNKVYEDDQVLAITDINPAVKGHILLLPKEHYPILPLVPPETQTHMYKVIRDLSRTLKKVRLTKGTNVFVANGGAAGQQAHHFMLHVMPRDPGDALESVFKLKPAEIDQEKQNQINQALKHNLQIAASKMPSAAQYKLEEKVVEQPAPVRTQAQPKQEVVQQPAKSEPVEISPEQKKKLAAFIEDNEDFRQALIKDVQKAKDMIANSLELQTLTDGMDIDALHQRLSAALGDGNE